MGRNSNSGGIGVALMVSALNQIVSSGTNFLLGLYLVRSLSPTDFGLFGIGFALSLFYAGIGNSLFLVQMVVHTPDKLLQDRRSFAARILVLIVTFSAATLVVAGILLLVTQVFFTEVEGFASYGMAVAFAAVTYLLKDFFVRHAYNVRRESLALVVNVAVGTCLLLILVFLRTQSLELTATGALGTYGLAHVAGGALGFLLAGLSCRGMRRAEVVQEMRTIWDGARWASITNVLEFLRAQSHTIMTAALLGPTSVAKMNAARLLVTPALMLTPTISQLAMPRLASIGLRDSKKTLSVGLRVGGGLLALAALYCSALLIGYSDAVALLLNDKYTNLFLITILWSVYTCIFSLKGGLEISWQVLRQFKRLTIIKAISALASLVTTYVLTVKYGVAGALIGLVAGEMVLVILLIAASRAPAAHQG